MRIKIGFKNGFFVKVKLYIYKNFWYIERIILVLVIINRKGNWSLEC